MACGTPVVTSNTSAIPEVAGPGAILVDPTSPTAIADALLHLETDPASPRRTGRLRTRTGQTLLLGTDGPAAAGALRIARQESANPPAAPNRRSGGRNSEAADKKRKGVALPFPFPVLAVLFSLHEVLLHAVQIPLLRHRAARLRPFEHLGISLQEIGLHRHAECRREY